MWPFPVVALCICICVPVLVNLYVQKVTGNPTQDGLQKKAWMFLRGAVTASLCRRCGRPQPLHIIPSRSWLLTVCHSYQRQTKADKGRQRETKTEKDRQRKTKTDKDRQRQTNSVLPFLSLLVADKRFFCVQYKSLSVLTTTLCHS